MDARKLIILPILALLIPVVQADEIGSPPALGCESVAINHSPGGTVPANWQGSTVDRNGNLYTLQYYNVNPFYAFALTKWDASCNAVWNIVSAGGDSFGCTGIGSSNGCDAKGITADAAGNVVIGLERISAVATPQNQYFLCKINGLTGVLIDCSEGFHTAELVAAGISQEQPGYSGLSSIRVSDTEVAYLMAQESGGKLSRWNDDLEVVWVASIAGATDVIADSQTDVAYLRSGGDFYKRINQVDGSTLHTSSFSSSNPDYVVQRSSTVAVGATGTTNIQYFTLDKDTFATILGATTPTPNQFQISGVDKTTRQTRWSVDGADDILACGYVEVIGANQAYAAKIDTTANTVPWGTMFNTVGSTDTFSNNDGVPCYFDYIDGFWVGGQTRVAGVTRVWIRHYPSTDFIQPVPPALVIPGDDAGQDGPAVVRLIQTRTAEAWGISAEAAGWAVGAIFFGFAIYNLGRRAPLITATMILLISIVLVFIQLWPWWILLLEAFLIVTFAGVQLFERGDRGNE